MTGSINNPSTVGDPLSVQERTSQLLLEQTHHLHRRTDRLFAGLMVLQVAAGIAAALWISPRTWIGDTSQVHIHVWAAVLLGIAIASLPIGAAVFNPGARLTRHIIAAGQMLMSALLIHVTGGRIETHFHVFGSLAFLAFYRDWRVLVTGTIVVAVDHFLRGVFWPQSVFGVFAASQWRWLEHVGWVVFEDAFLLWSCQTQVREMRDLAHRQAQLEHVNRTIEETVQERTKSLRQSEEKFRSFVDNIPGVTYRITWGTDARVEFAGGNVYGLTGFDSESLSGQDPNEVLARLVHEEDRWVLEAFPQALEKKGRFSGEYRIVRTDGETRWIRDEARAVMQDGRIMHIDGVILNVTERREAEEELRKVQERLDMAIRAANEGLWDWNLKTDEIYFNDTAFTMLGYEVGEVPKTLDVWKQLMHPDDLQRAMAETERHLKGEIPVYRCEVRVRAKNGRWKWILDVGEVTERDQDGRPTRMLGVHTDVTDLREAREQAEAADRAKSEFLSNMSHELRTPLNGVLGYTQILLNDSKLNEDQQHGLNAIRNCGEHLLTLINDVLDLSKIEAGRLELEPDACDFHALLQSVRDVFAQRAADKGLQLEIDVAPEVARVIRTDSTKLKQVLVNLVGNAVKFTERGSVKVSVSEMPDQRLQIAVSDTGVGMTPDDLENAFDPFKQAAAGKQAGGTGLGLAISQRIVEAMKGSLTAESRVGSGSVFTLRIPLVEEHEEALAAVATQTLGSSAPHLPASVRKRILIADDREENRDVLDRLLRGAGFETVLVNDGQAVLDVLVREPIDLVLMDVRMPRLNGIEATRRLRHDLQLRNLPVIAVTASVFPNQRQRIIEVGCDDFLGKPLRADELFAKLQQHLKITWDTETQRDVVNDASDVLPPAPRDVLEDIVKRMHEMVSMGDFGALQDLADELLARGDGAKSLGAELTQHIRDFDLAGVKALVERMTAGLNA